MFTGEEAKEKEDDEGEGTPAQTVAPTLGGGGGVVATAAEDEEVKDQQQGRAWPAGSAALLVAFLARSLAWVLCVSWLCVCVGVGETGAWRRCAWEAQHSTWPNEKKQEGTQGRTRGLPFRARMPLERRTITTDFGSNNHDKLIAHKQRVL